jgi:hypothetical protein
MSRLTRLEGKRRNRTSKRNRYMKRRARQVRLYKATGQDGYKKRAAKLLKRADRQGKAIKKLDKLIDKARKAQPESGTGAWGGSKSIVQNEVNTVAHRWGIAKTSAKRWATFGNPGSDHHMLNRTAFAKDYATTNNYAFGVAIGKSLGIDYRGAMDDYKNFYIKRAGKTFRVQIICGTHGTGPHTHVGIRRV